MRTVHVHLAGLSGFFLSIFPFSAAPCIALECLAPNLSSQSKDWPFCFCFFLKETFNESKSWSEKFLFFSVQFSIEHGKQTKGSLKTSILSGSTFNVTWHLGYPHRGGYRIQVLDASEKPILDLTNGGQQNKSSVFVEGDPTALSYLVQLPKDLECRDCTIRLIRQASEWGKNYMFWSCADVDIIPRKSSLHPSLFFFFCSTKLMFEYLKKNKVQSIVKPVRDTAKTLRDVVDATRFIRDTVANIATNAARTRTAAGMASASIWRPPPTQRSNASARWDGLDRNAINVRAQNFFYIFYLLYSFTLSRRSFNNRPGEGRRGGTTPEHIWITSK